MESPADVILLSPELHLTELNPVLEVGITTPEICDLLSPVYIPSSKEIQAIKLRVPALGTCFSRDENTRLCRILATPSSKSSSNGTYNWETISTQFAFKAKAELFANPLFNVYLRNAEALRQRKKTMDKEEKKKN